MSNLVVYVDEITSGCCQRGIFTLLHEGTPIGDPFVSYPPNEWYSYIHHFQYDDICRLQASFPELIPPCSPYYNLTSWGERVKCGIYKLISQGYFNRVSETNGTAYEIRWSGIRPEEKPIQLNKNPRKQSVGSF